jgi:cytochrome P450
MGLVTSLAGRLASFSPRLTGIAARLVANPFRYLQGKPLARQLLVYRLPHARLALANDLNIVETVLTDRAGTFPKSAVLELLLRPLIGAGVFGQPGGDPVRQARRIYVRALTRLTDADIARVAGDLTREYLAAWQADGVPVPIPSELSRLTIDIVSQATLGTRFTTEEGRRFVDLFFEYHRRANPLVVVLGPADPQARQGLVDSMGLVEIGDQMRALMRRRFLEPLLAAGPVAGTFAAALLEPGSATDGNHADPATQTRILDEIAVMLLAGHETTASLLSWLFWALAGRMVDQDRSASLLAGAEGAGEGPESPARVRASQWLDALIQESLRLWPPIAFLLRETTQNQEFRGKALAAGDFLVISPWTIQRHRDLWREPDAFDPTRWMAAEPPPALANRYAFIPFGYGPRVCPGKRFAEVEMHAILAEVLGAWRLRRVDRGQPRPLGSLTSRPDLDFRLDIEPRHRS